MKKITNKITNGETNEQQTNNKQITTTEEIKNINNINNINTTDERKSKIAKFYEENIGTLNPTTVEFLFSYLDDMSDEMIMQAIKIACLQNVRKAKYIGGILDDWRKKGYKVLADINESKEKTDEKERNEKILDILRRVKEENARN